MKERISISIEPELLAHISTDNRSAAIERLVQHAAETRRWVKRTRLFSIEEGCLIFDVLNGIAPDFINPVFIPHSVADGIRMDGLDKKWGVDVNDFLRRLNSLSPLDLLIVEEMALEFWSGDLNRDIRESVAEFFGTPAVKAAVCIEDELERQGVAVDDDDDYDDE